MWGIKSLTSCTISIFIHDRGSRGEVCIKYGVTAINIYFPTPFSITYVVCLKKISIKRHRIQFISCAEYSIIYTK